MVVQAIFLKSEIVFVRAWKSNGKKSN